MTSKLPTTDTDTGMPLRTPQTAPLLLVEDDVVNQIVARGVLASLGYTRVTLAAHGLEALHACEQASFALVLMDCQMPEMDGLAATRILRGRGVTTPIVALTASTVPGDRQRCLAAGMDDYLTKPIDSGVLGRTLQRWIGTEPRDTSAQQAGGGAAPQPAPAFDPSTLKERFFDENALFAECRRIFLAQTPGWLEELGGCCDNGDLVRARYLAHTAKGSAATIGARRLAECCVGIEQALDGPGGAAAATAWLVRAHAALADFVQASEAVTSVAWPVLPAGTTGMPAAVRAAPSTP